MNAVRKLCKRNNMSFSSQIQLLLLLVLLSGAFVSSASLPTLSDVHRYDPDPSITHWAVKIDSKSSSFGSYVFGTMDTEQRADAIATELGLVNGGRIEPFKDIYKFVLPSTSGDQTSNDVYNGHNHDEVVRSVEYQVGHFDKQLNEHSGLLWSSKQVPLKRAKRTLPPERDLRKVALVIKFNDPKYRLQWHLVNDKELGNDVNVTGIWSHNITGRGVVIAVVDDGLEHTNIDIADNYNVLGSYDFNDGDSDPTPNLKTAADNTHGTRCAGLIAAVANNSACGVGVAHEAQVSGIRMLDGTVTDILEGQSFIYKAHVNDIYSCSWGPEDNGQSIEGPGYIAKEALQLGTKIGRYGYGNVYVFASGNGGTVNDNCNFDGYANSIYTLTIGAVDELNRMPYYAELCAAMLAVTYSNGPRRNIVTTDGSNHGGCTTGFSGTSAAAPIAAGMVALMLEVRPCLSWRDVQSIVIYSAVKVDAQGATWVRNGAGFHHSDQHGFGLMDAYRLTMSAAVWPLLPAMVECVVKGRKGAESLPSSGQPLIRSIEVSHNDLAEGLVTLEYVAVTMKVTHVCRGALEISLVSPNGTLSTLITTRRYDRSTEGLDWTLTTARFWGEQPTGTWTLNITDNTHLCHDEVRRNGALVKWTLTFYGSSVTRDDIVTRQRLVEEAVSNGSLESPFPCPPAGHQPTDIKLPEVSKSSWELWEKVGLTVVAVLIAVILMHILSEWFLKKVKGCRRPHPPATAVLFTKRHGQTINGDESESEETCALLVREGGVASSREDHVTGHHTENGTINRCDSICKKVDMFTRRGTQGEGVLLTEDNCSEGHSCRRCTGTVVDIDTPRHHDVTNTTELVHQSSTLHTLVTIDQHDDTNPVGQGGDEDTNLLLPEHQNYHTDDPSTPTEHVDSGFNIDMDGLTAMQTPTGETGQTGLMQTPTGETGQTGLLNSSNEEHYKRVVCESCDKSTCACDVSSSVSQPLNF